MAGHTLLASTFKKNSQNGLTRRLEQGQLKAQHASYPANTFDDDLQASLRDSSRQQMPASPPIDAESYFNSLNSLRSSRANSIYSLSRISLSSQLSQLTSLALPNASSLSTSISSIPTAPAAANTLSNAAEQIRKWLLKASEVLNGLDAEDDVEWAAAGGREGLGDVDTAIGKFERLIGVYVSAIENLQEREDIEKVPSEQLKAVVDQMERTLKDWENVRRSLKGIKAQVELAMEWEELWNVVLGDIGLEMENLSRLVFEMEEARHRDLLSDPALDSNGALDMQELDTIVEEGEKKPKAQHITLPYDLPAASPITSPTTGVAQDDTRLLALFARMQPLRASLDFLPMTLSSFQTRAESVLPTACEELETRRKSLEKKWKGLETDAERLRQELGEDRWVLVFRNAGRQAQKLCESVERSITKLQEYIDLGTQHSNPPLLAKKVEAYEGKRSHYGPAIEKVLGIIEKGVADRLTVNGEILRLHLDTKTRWKSIKSEMKDMDLALDDLTKNKNQQLRDSISSIMSMDRSAAGSTVNTPGSSPASSVIMTSTQSHKRDPSPSMNGSSRRSSVISGSTSRPNGSRRLFSMPSRPVTSSQLPRGKNPSFRNLSYDGLPSSRGASPAPYGNQSSTPTPGSRPQRPSLQSDNKPRWNSSPKVDYFEFGSKPKASHFSTPPVGRRASQALRSPSSTVSQSSALPLPSPLGRSSPAPSSATAALPYRPRLSSGAQSSLGMHHSSLSSPANSTDWVKVKDKSSPISTTAKRQSIRLDSTPDMPPNEDSPSARPRPQRPNTAMASSRRVSMLPLPKNSLPLLNGRETSMAMISSNGHGRDSSLGSKAGSNGQESSMVSNSALKGKEAGSGGKGTSRGWK